MTETTKGPPASWAPAAVAAGILIAQQVVGRATRDALFLTSFPATQLPAMGVLAAVVSLGAVLGFARAMATLTPSRAVPGAFGLSAALLVVEWAVAGPMPRVAAVAVYLHMGVFGATLVSAYWSMVNERFDPYTAKRMIGRIGTGASLGGALGGLIAWQASRVVSVRAMLLAMAALSVACLVAVLPLRAPTGSAPRAARTAGGAPSGVPLIVASPYFQYLAALMIGAAFLDTLVDFAFNATARHHFGPGAPLLAFFAAFQAIAATLTLAVQVALTRWSLVRLGLGGTLAVQPATVAVAALAAQGFATVAGLSLVRGAHQVLRNSLFRSAYELLYTPLPSDRKRLAKPLIDVGCDRLGTIAGNAAVMLVLAIVGMGMAASVATEEEIAIRLAAAATPSVLILAGLTAAAMAALAPWLWRGYVAALGDNLRSGAAGLDEGAIADAMSRQTLAEFAARPEPWGAPEPQPSVVEGGRANADPTLEAIADLRSGDELRIRRVLSAEAPAPALIPHVIPLLARDRLFADVVATLRRSGATAIGQLLDAVLDPAQPASVRRRVPRVLKAFPTPRAFDGLFAVLAEVPFDVRYRCGQALLRMRTANTALAAPPAAVFSAAGRELDTGARSGRVVEHVFTVLALGLDREPLSTCVWALRHGDPGLRGTALEYLDNVLPAALKQKLWPHLGDERPASRGRSTQEIREDLLRSTAAAGRRIRSRSGIQAAD
jgi:ATP:ADP antiporter, AAA family